MASPIQIDSVFSLARVPRPLDSTHGLVQTSSVFSHTKSKKRRKRCEVVSVTDGEGINIYNVQNGHLVTSHALPPHYTFSCPPCSIYQFSKQQNCTLRFTYAAVSSSGHEGPTELHCYQDTSKAGDPATRSKLQCKLSSAAPVLHIETLPVSTTDIHCRDHDVLVFHVDGTVQSFSSDLSPLSKSFNALFDASSTPSTKKNQMCVTQISSADAQAVSKGVFRERPDIAAVLGRGSSLDGNRLSQQCVLFILTAPSAMRQETGCLELHVLAITPRASSVPFTKSQFRILRTYQLPFNLCDASAPQTPSKLLVNAAAGTTHVLKGNRIINYSLIGSSPSVISEIHNNGLVDFLILSKSLLLAASDTCYIVYDTQFSSIQAQVLRDDHSTQSGKKRKRSSETGASLLTLALTDYYSSLGLAVGLRGHELVAVQLKPGSNESSKRRKLDTTRLVDALGRGVPNTHFSELKPPTWNESLIGKPLPDSSILVQASSSSWAGVAEQLVSCASRSACDEFDELFAGFLGISLRSELEKIPDNVNFAGGSSWADERKVWRPKQDCTGARPVWYFPHKPRKLRAFREQAIFVMGLIFQRSPKIPDGSAVAKGMDRTPVYIRFFPPNTFRWLILTGQLSATLVEQALKQRENSVSRAEVVSSGDLVTAITSFDPTFGLLHSILLYHLDLDLAESVQATKFIIRSFHETSIPTTDTTHPKPLPKGTRTHTSTQAYTNARTSDDAPNPASNDDVDTAVAAETFAAETDLDLALSTLEYGIPVREEILQFALAKIYSAPTQRIVETLRAHLARTDLVNLINHLRVELHRGGWVSRYVEDKEGDQEQDRDRDQDHDLGQSDIDAYPTTATENSQHHHYGRRHIDVSNSDHDHTLAVIAQLLCCAVDAIGPVGWLVAREGDSDVNDDILWALREEVSAALEGVHEAEFMKGLVGEFLRFAWRREAGKEAKPKWVGKHKERTGGKKEKGEEEEVSLDLGTDGRGILVDAVSERPELPLGMTVEIPVWKRLGPRGVIQERTKRNFSMRISIGVERYQFERIRVGRRTVVG